MRLLKINLNLQTLESMYDYIRGMSAKGNTPFRLLKQSKDFDDSWHTDLSMRFKIVK